MENFYRKNQDFLCSSAVMWERKFSDKSFELTLKTNNTRIVSFATIAGL